MHILLPFLALYRRHSRLIALSLFLSVIALLAGIALLTLSGWFLAASALAGLAGLVTFNYMLPAAGVRGSAITRTAGRYGERLISHDVTFRILAHLRVFTFQKILPLSAQKTLQFRQAELLNRLVADVDTLDHLYLRVISPLISAFIVIIVITIGLSFLDITLACVLGAILLALLFIIPPLFYQAGKPTGQAITQLRSHYRSAIASWLQGQAELVIFGAVDRARCEFEKIEKQWQQQQTHQATLTGLAQALFTLVSGLVAILLLWLAAADVGPHSQPSALISLFLFVTLAAFEALLPVMGAFQHLGQVIASATRIKQLIDQKPDIIFPHQGPKAQNSAALTLNQVSFRYPNQLQPTLHQIDLTLKAGEHIALLGRTGSGKSTLLHLITRSWNNDSGEILLNGIPLASYDEATLRAMITVISQRVYIFSDSLRENLKLAAPDADDKTLIKVLQQVGLENLLIDDGLNTWLGDGGRQLSGGEKRRIGITRALLHPAPLLLLDEPTEGLDVNTEQKILALLKEHAKNKTLLMITHRLSGLMHFDSIYILENGKIIEQGNHETLLQRQGRYASFHQRITSTTA